MRSTEKYKRLPHANFEAIAHFTFVEFRTHALIASFASDGSAVKFTDSAWPLNWDSTIERNSGFTWGTGFLQWIMRKSYDGITHRFHEQDQRVFRDDTISLSSLNSDETTHVISFKKNGLASYHRETWERKCSLYWVRFLGLLKGLECFWFLKEPIKDKKI